MGTHPIFESDFDCLTVFEKIQIMAEQARLTQNLEVVEANVRMLNQIMEDTAVPGTEDARDRALLDKLEISCRQMQERITILLSEMDPDQSGIVFMECLRVNEDLNSVFNRFERFKKSRPAPRVADDVAPLPQDPCPTGFLVDVDANSDANASNNVTGGGPSSPGQVNEEFWLNMNQESSTTPM